MRESSNLREDCGFCGGFILAVGAFADDFQRTVSLTGWTDLAAEVSVGSGRLLSCAQPAADSSIAAANQYGTAVFSWLVHPPFGCR